MPVIDLARFILLHVKTRRRGSDGGRGKVLAKIDIGGLAKTDTAVILCARVSKRSCRALLLSPALLNICHFTHCRCHRHDYHKQHHNAGITVAASTIVITSTITIIYKRAWSFSCCHVYSGRVRRAASMKF